MEYTWSVNSSLSDKSLCRLTKRVIQPLPPNPHLIKLPSPQLIHANTHTNTCTHACINFYNKNPDLGNNTHQPLLTPPPPTHHAMVYHACPIKYLERGRYSRERERKRTRRRKWMVQYLMNYPTTLSLSLSLTLLCTAGVQQSNQTWPSDKNRHQKPTSLSFYFLATALISPPPPPPYLTRKQPLYTLVPVF